MPKSAPPNTTGSSGQYLYTALTKYSVLEHLRPGPLCVCVCVCASRVAPSSETRGSMTSSNSPQAKAEASTAEKTKFPARAGPRPTIGLHAERISPPRPRAPGPVIGLTAKKPNLRAGIVPDCYSWVGFRRGLWSVMGAGRGALFFLVEAVWWGPRWYFSPGETDRDVAPMLRAVYLCVGKERLGRESARTRGRRRMMSAWSVPVSVGDE